MIEQAHWLDLLLPATSLVQFLGKLATGIAGENSNRELSVCAFDGHEWQAVSLLDNGSLQHWTARDVDAFWREIGLLVPASSPKPHFTPWFWNDALLGGVVQTPVRVANGVAHHAVWNRLNQLAPRMIRQLQWHDASQRSPSLTVLSTPPPTVERSLQAKPLLDANSAGDEVATPFEAASSGCLLPNRQHLEAMAEFAAGAGHEINNPLATIIGRASRLLKGETDPARQQELRIIGSQAYRIRDMIGDVMLFARPPKPEFRSVNLGDVVRQQLASMESRLRESGCTLDSEIDDLDAECDPAQISIVVAELVRNSSEALSPEGGSIQVLVERDGSTNAAVLIVADTARGFDEISRRHAFDPFFSGRQAGRGLGFGLCKVWRIVDQHHGTIAIDSHPDTGTTVTVTLPLPVARDIPQREI